MPQHQGGLADCSMQVSIQLFLDGSGQLLFRNLTLLGAASKAHYDMYGPSASLLLTETVVVCRGTAAAVPPGVGPPQRSVLGIPANTTQVKLCGSDMHLATSLANADTAHTLV